MYDLHIERNAEKDFKKIPKNDFLKIIPEIKSLSNNPRPAGCRKITGTDHSWRIRIGDYRVIYDIDDNCNVDDFIISPL